MRGRQVGKVVGFGSSVDGALDALGQLFIGKLIRERLVCVCVGYGEGCVRGSKLVGQARDGKF